MPPKAKRPKSGKEKKAKKEKKEKRRREPPPPPEEDPTVKELAQQFERRKEKEKETATESESESEREPEGVSESAVEKEAVGGPAPRGAEPAPEPEPSGTGVYSLWDDAANAAAPAVESGAAGAPAAVDAADINDLFADVMAGAALDPLEEAKRKEEQERLAKEEEKEQRARERAERRAKLQAEKDAAQAEAEALQAKRAEALQAALEEEAAEERAAKAAEEKARFEEKVAEAAEKAAKRMLKDEAAQERRARKEAEREARRAEKAAQRKRREMQKLDERRAEKERKELEALVQAQTDEIYQERIAEIMPSAPVGAVAASGSVLVAPMTRGGIAPAARSFRVKAPALIRAGFAANSAERGILEPGQVVTAQTIRRNERLGVTRIKFEQGWVSSRAGDGTVLLVELDSAGNELDVEDEVEVETVYETVDGGASETDWTSELESETEFETELETGSEYTYAESVPDSEYSTGGDSAYGDAPLAEQYLVVSAGKIRSGWQMDAPEVGVTQEDQIIDVIEGRALDTGILRVRFSRGWVSTQAQDGTQLLLPVGVDESSTESEYTMMTRESETEFETELDSETDFQSEQPSETEFETDMDSETEFETEMSTGDSETYAASSVASETSFETDTSASETQFETESEASTEWTETTELTETVMTETDFSETELTETHATTEPPLPDEGPEVGSKLEVVAPAKVRRRFEPDSEDLGIAEVGQVIDVLDKQKTANGIWRVCFSHADETDDQRWVSVMAGDGTQLLRAVRGLKDWVPPVVAQELAEEYIVVSTVDVRQNFEPNSKVIMQFEPGTQRKPSKVIPLEGKQDENGVMQLRVQYGWLSTHDSDGTVLLLAVRKNVAAKKYRAVADAMIREEFDVGSRQVGVLEKSDVIEVSDSKVTDSDVLRVKGRVIRGRAPLEGWVSEKAKDGTLLLAVVEERDLEAEIKAQEFRPGIHTASTYVVRHPALVRAQFVQTSAERGILEPGETIHVLEGRETETGILRIKCDKGWVSTTSKDGTVLLAALGEDDQRGFDDSASTFDDDDETEFSTGGDSWEEEASTPAEKYCVVAQSRVRAGFDQDSEDMGVIDPGEVIAALEGRVNANGVMRIRFAGGWLSTVAADGTTLLTEVIEDEEPHDDLETVYTLKSGTSDADEESETDLETVTEVTEFGRALSRKYKVVHTALLREGVSQNTRGCGTVKPGEIIDVLEGRMNEQGIMRVRISRGWLSVKSSDGTALLEPLANEEESDTESDVSSVTDTQSSRSRTSTSGPAKQYRVTAKGGAKVRSGFEATSEEAGVLAFGETIDTVDGRRNEAGVMRVRCEQGWVNTKAGDGTILLTAVEQPAPKYRVVAHTGAKVRAGFAASSKDLGAVGFDEVLDVLDGRLNPSGVMRIKFRHGDTSAWVNTKAGDGTVLLEPIGGDEVLGEAESDYSYETETQTSHNSASSRRSRSSRASSQQTATENSAVVQYKCLVPSKCRAGFEMNSKDMGILKPDEEIHALESRQLKPGVLRIKFKKGEQIVWVSTAAGDGTPLLQKLEAQLDEESEFESESEVETETETETEHDDPFAGESSRYKVLCPAKVRAGFDTTSADAGICKPGEIIQATQTRRNASGILRIKFERGWVSEKAMDGTALLSVVGSSARPAEGTEDGSEWETATASETSGKRSAFEQTDNEDEETESDSGWETATVSEESQRLAKFMQETVSHTANRKVTQYRVEVPARVRAGFEATSEDRGIAQPGDIIDVIESRKNESGILRVRYTRGWVSEFAGDGSRLLAAVEFADDDESEFETETDMSKGTAIDRFEAAGTAASKYVVIASCKVRGEFETDSAVMGVLKTGEVIETVEGRMNAGGVMRVRFSRDTVPYGGWVSVRAGDGTRLLQPVDRRIADYEDTESEFETDTQVSDESETSVQTTGEEEWRRYTPDNADDFQDTCQRYTFIGSAVVRAEFDPTSEFVGTLSTGEVVECLESRVDPQGGLRIKCSIGWFSECATDGTKLVREGTVWYRVVSEAVVRTGREISSARCKRNLHKDEVIEAFEVWRIDSSETEAGLLRVRFQRGWTSVTAGNGVTLLVPLSPEDTVVQEAAKKLLREQQYGPIAEKKPKQLQKWQIRMEAERKAREVVLAKIKEEAEWLARVEEAKKTSVTMTEVAQWLESENLPQFQRRFAAQGFDDLKTLKALTIERMEAVVQTVGDGMKQGHVLKLRIALEKLLDHVRDGTVKAPKRYGLDDDPDETTADDSYPSSHAQLLEEGAFVPHSFDTHYPIPSENELAELAAAQAAAEAAALEAAETAAAEAKRKTEEETAQIVAEAKAKMAQEAIDADARALRAQERVAAEAAAKDEAEKMSAAALQLAETAENKWVAAGEERARVTASAAGAAAAATAARVSTDEAMERRSAAQQWLAELKIALSDKEKASAAASEKLALEEESLRLANIEVPRVEAISNEVAAARKALEDEAASLIERERNASLQARLDDEKAVSAEQTASRMAMLAAQLQEQTMTKALLAAAMRGDTHGVETLLTKGVDGVKPHIDVVDPDGEAAITKAALNGHKETVALLRTLGANVELLPVAQWSVEQVAAWCDREFKWFGKYAAQLASAMIDGAALLEYGAPEYGERLLQTDLDISIRAHRRVLQQRIVELCEREEARAARLLAAAQAERLALTAAIQVKEAEKVRAVEADARARLLEIEANRRKTEQDTAANITPAQKLGIRQAVNGPSATTSLHPDELTRRAMIDKQLLEETTRTDAQSTRYAGGNGGDDLSDPVPEDLQHELQANMATAEADAINISIRIPSGEWRKMRLGKGVLVQELQARLAVSCGVPVASQTLLHKLRPLPEWQSLGACGVEDKAVIHLKSSAAQPRKLKLLLSK